MFDRFDDVEVPDQWDDIAARANGPSGPGYRPGGHRTAILAVAAAAVVGLAGVLWVVSGNGDDLATVDTPPADTVPASTMPATIAPPPTAPPTTVEVTQPPPTTEAVVTVAETAPPATIAPPSTVPTESTFACGELAGDPSAEYEDDPTLKTFGPLSAAPALDITTGSPGVLNENADVARVPGGVAILLQTRWDELPGWSVTVVNDDGTIRWRRCGNQTEVGSLLSTAGALVMSEHQPDATYPPPTTWRLLNASTGADSGGLQIPSSDERLFSFEDVTRAPRFMLFGRHMQYDPSGAPMPFPEDDHLHVLDTATLEVTDFPYPHDYYYGGDLTGWLQLVETPDSESGWFVKQYASDYPIIASVFVDGAWSTDPAVISRVVPIAAFSPNLGDWSGFDPIGNVVWTIADKQVLIEEGPVWREDGDLDLLSVCERYDTTSDGGSACRSPALLGVDGQTGAILWELPGHRQTAAIGDGYALISEAITNSTDGPPEGWLMIETSTGQPVDGQEWPDYETFNMGGSMEEDGMWVGRRGGVMWAVNGEHVRVWFPAGLSTDTINLSL